MRLILALCLSLLLVLPSTAQGWGSYDNGRFSFSIAVPPDFEAQGESANGDGQRFVQRGRPSTLTAWGGWITGVQSDFSSLVDWSMKIDAKDGWAITYQASTPSWASWSGSKGGRILYQRMIQLCGGDSYTAFRMEYSQADRGTIDPIIERLVPSLKSTGC